MDLNNIPTWLASLIISLIITFFYYIIKKNSEDKSKKKYIIMFIIIFFAAYISISCITGNQIIPSIIKTGGSKKPPKPLQRDAKLPNF